MRYALYARKSSESEERQVQSIEDQVRVLREVAAQRTLQVVEEITESKSAKDPGQRPAFERMLQQIERGQMEGILCWNVNRLSRNPIESGKLSWMLQQGVLQRIQTPERSYLPEDNVLLFSVETGMANQYILDLKKAVKRGMDSKIQKGWFPHRAPEGYLNNLRTHTIEADPDRFALLQRAWRTLLTGTTTVSHVVHRLNEEWGYRTRLTEKTGGMKLSRATGYRLFTNVFYAGYFETKGITYRGQHPPMITLEEFEQAQRQIRRQIGKPHYHKHPFAYVGLIRCARCGRAVTAEVQRGYKQRGHYVYYHCSNSTGRCSKRGLREEVLEQRMDACLKQITITPEFKAIVQEELEVWIREELGGQETLYHQQLRALSEREQMLNELLEMRLRQLVDDDRFREKQTDLQQQVSALRLALTRTQGRLDRTRAIMDAALDFRLHAREQFLLGNLEKKREIARCLGVRYVYEAGAVSIELNPLLVPMQAGEDRSSGGDIELPQGVVSNSKQGAVAPDVSVGSADYTDTGLPLRGAAFKTQLHKLFRLVADGGLTFPQEGNWSSLTSKAGDIV